LAGLGQYAVALQVTICANIGNDIKGVVGFFEGPPWFVEAYRPIPCRRRNDGYLLGMGQGGNVGLDLAE
jgi:hypothetical protein